MYIAKQYGNTLQVIMRYTKGFGPNPQQASEFLSFVNENLLRPSVIGNPLQGPHENHNVCVT
jgi:hypothetical protein